MIPDTITWRGHKWLLHSYVYDKKKATKIADEVEKRDHNKTAKIIEIPPGIADLGVRYAVYWRNKK
jgi:hypothetical protein